ncbi:PAS domain S-box protein [Hymenobacter gummosus]|uniref:histidine kinase n=1 Tax=Hymenobacter gummosus TaxID=1776032 RepID=A0A3S0H7H6_9BACT|nr:PAS domain-containing protein [Hymenobacter gummosus]RTQ47574.1 PAS domain S-box protein [Hymenobacter gummosus]
MLSTALPDRPAGLLDTLVSISLTAVALLRPVYASDGVLTDFAWAYLNPAGQRLFRQPEVPAASLRVLFPAAVADGVFEQCRQAFLSGQAQPHPASYPADGLDGHFQLTAQRCDELLVVSFAATNEQPRPAAEQALRESQAREQAARAEAEAQRQRLTQVLMQMPANIALLRGPEHVYDLVNPEYERLFPARTTLGRSIREVIPELEGQGFYELFDQVYQTGEPYDAPEAEAWADFAGTGQLQRRYYRTSFQPIRDASGAVTEVLNFAVDVTELVEARQQVQRLNEELQAARAHTERERNLLQALLTQAPVAIGLFQGEELRITTVTEHMAAVWGRTPAQVLGRPLLEALPELQGQGFDELLRQVLRTQVPVTGTETPATMLRDGRLQTTYYNFVYQPIYDAQGAVLGVVDVAVEVSEQVQARRQIQELNEQLQTRTREAEAARAAAERQRGELQRIFEQAPVAIAVYRGPRYTIELANATVARLWGRTQEQLIGKGLFEALPEVAGMGYEQLLDHVMASGETHVAHAMEAQHDRNGQRETVYWDFVYVPVYAADGRIDGAMVVANEVTAQVLARRQLEQLNQELEARVQERTRQLRQQSRRVERLVQEAPAAIALLDGPELVFELLNDDYQAMFPERELLGRPVLAAVPELADTPLADALRKVYRTGETFEGQEFPIPFAGPDGQVQHRYFDFIYQARYDAAGTVDGVVIFGFEVSERVQRRLQTEALQAELLAAAERRAQERQDLIRIFEQAPAAICLLREPDHQIDYFNASFARLFPGENLRGRLVGEAYPDAFSANLIGLLDRVYQTGDTYTGVEYVLPVAPHPDRPGQPRYFNFTYQAYREQGRIVGVAVFLYEVTEQVLARQQVQELHEELAALNEELAATNEELLAANEELLTSNTRLSHTNSDLDTFVYTASHDLKAPITNLDGLLGVLRDEATTGIWTDTAGHVLTLMQDSIERFRATLGHLTEITRLQPELESAAPVDLAFIIDGVELDLAPLLSVARAEVHVDVAACPTLRVPAKTVRSVIYNLLSNALKYRSPERPPVVHVRCRLEAQQPVLEVQDNGLGIDLARQTELFGMFRRYHTHVEGAGVGLYMVKRMVEHVGGRIEVHSQIGQGSTFIVRFPRHR